MYALLHDQAIKFAELSFDQRFNYDRISINCLLVQLYDVLQG